MSDSNFPAGNASEHPHSATDDGAASWETDPDVVTQRVEGETVLVHLQTNEIYALNATASRAWDLITAGLNRKAVQEELEREFDAPEEQIREEMEALISNLVAKNLLRPTVA